MSTAKITARARQRPRLCVSRKVMRRRVLRGAAGLSCAGFAVAHVVLLLWTQYAGVQSGIVNWPVLLAPAVLTIVFLPASWRHWRRWALFYFIVFICNPVLLPQALVLTETVVLYSIWVRDRRPGDLDWIRTAISGLVARVARITRPAHRGRSGPVCGEVPANPLSRTAKSGPRAKGGPAPKHPRHQRTRAHAKER